MAAKRKRVSFSLPVALAREIDALVGPRQRSSFITVAAELELCRRRIAASKFASIEAPDPPKPSKQIYVN